MYAVLLHVVQIDVLPSKWAKVKLKGCCMQQYQNKTRNREEVLTDDSNCAHHVNLPALSFLSVHLKLTAYISSYLSGIHHILSSQLKTHLFFTVHHRSSQVSKEFYVVGA